MAGLLDFDDPVSRAGLSAGLLNAASAIGMAGNNPRYETGHLIGMGAGAFGQGRAQAMQIAQKQIAEQQRQQAMQQMIAGIKDPHQRRIAMMNPQAYSKAMAEAAARGPKERRIIKGADGRNYYADTGEPVLPGMEPKATTLQQNYAAAVEQGYEGTIFDYQRDLKRAGAPRNITEGAIPQDHRAVRDPETGRIMHYEVIPGSPTARKMAADQAKLEQDAKDAAAQNAVKNESSLSKGGTVIQAVDDINKIFKENEGRHHMLAGTMARIPGQLSNSPAGQIASYVGTLKSAVVLDAMMRLKDASKQGSTGFGAMNAGEMQVLADQMGSLDQYNTHPKIFLRNINRIRDRFKRTVEKIAREASIEDIRRENLEPLFDASGVPLPGQSAKKAPSGFIVDGDGWGVRK